MLRIVVYGYAEQAICAGCESHPGEGAGCASCQPGQKKETRALVEEFASLLQGSEYSGKALVEFRQVDDSTKEEAPEVHHLLTMADLAPAIAVDGKVLFLGGFSPEGLLDELRKRYPAPA